MPISLQRLNVCSFAIGLMIFGLIAKAGDIPPSNTSDLQRTIAAEEYAPGPIEGASHITAAPRTSISQTSFASQTSLLADVRDQQSQNSSRTSQTTQNDETDYAHASEERGNTRLEEILVTAQKRTERIQDVPVSMTALDASTLAENGQTRLQDYFETVPGLSFTAGGSVGGGGFQTLAIRGITTGTANSANPTVGVTIDDVPFGSSTLIGLGSLLYPDIDPSDLSQIEVLRGPQGTLYGASSIGGLIKFGTIDPSTDGFKGRVQVLGNDVEHGNLGYGVSGAVNVPVSDALAFRASAFTRRDPGYIENASTGQKGVNEVDVSGGQFSVLWRASDVVSLKVSALLQNTDGYGNAAVDTNAGLQPTIGDFQQMRLRSTGGYNIEARLYTAALKTKFDGLDFTSISGYGINKYSRTDDASGYYGSFAQLIYGVSGASMKEAVETRKITQEFRLSSGAGQKLEWLAGAFYTHENSPIDATFLANDAMTGRPAGVLINFNSTSNCCAFTEYALFADVTVHFTDRLDLQFGARESHDKQTFNETDSGPLTTTFDGVAPPYVQPEEAISANAFTYLLTPRFKVSRDLMVYARFASGYRVGGPNIEAALLSVPAEYKPDKTNNYELGVKGEFLDRRLSVDASIYYIDWRQIQLTLTNPANFAAYVANGGNAKSQGLELSLQGRPTEGLKLTAAVSVNDAELRQNLPPESSAFGVAGDRLPFSSRFSGSVSGEQDVHGTSGLRGFFGGSLNYLSAREGDFAVTPTQGRFRFPAYADLDLRTGLRHESWTVNVFLNNACDKRGIVGGGFAGAGSGYYAMYIQPRTVGVSVAKTF